MKEWINNWLQEGQKVTEDKFKIKVKENIFDYQTNDILKPVNNNSFVCDLETYTESIENSNIPPIITIIAYAGLSYLTKNSKDKKKPIPKYFEEFKPTTLGIKSDSSPGLDIQDKEVEIFIKMLEDMIQQVKKHSDCKNKNIIIYMFNSSGYDNSFFIKLLVKLGYIQTLDSNIHKNVKNLEEIQPLRDKLKVLLQQLDYCEDFEKKEIENNIKAIRKQILKQCKYESHYNKEFTMLSNASIGNLTLKFGYKDYKFQIVDIMRYYPSNLKTLGKIVGVDKLLDIGAKYYDRHYDSLTAEEWKEYKYYAEVDIEILWKAIKKLSNQITFDKSTILTISGLTMDKWKQKEPINKKYFRIDKSEWETGKLGYRGGFSFVNEKYLNKIVNNVNTYDINSSYPSSMLKPIACEEITENEVEEVKENNKVVKYVLVEFHNFELKEDMLPIIPLLFSGTNNAFYKDYNLEKARKIFNHKPEKDKVFSAFQMWVWEEELEWFKKFYNNFDYVVLETKYFMCKSLFINYINEHYIKKAQADIDKLICSIIKGYLNHKQLNKVNEEIDKTFPKYFNDKNTLLMNGIDYHNEYKTIILNEINKIDKYDSNQLQEYIKHLDNQLLYLEVIRNTTKLFLNSLYGKFGQNPDMDSNFITDITAKKDNHFRICVNEILEDYHTYNVTTEKGHKVLDKNVYSIQRVDKTKEKANNVYIASYITMLSRLKMYEVIFKYGNTKVLYGDTDSIKMFGELDSSYINNTELGKWKYEGNYEKFAYIGSKKYMYRENNKFSYHIAGMNKLDTDKYPNYENDKDIQDKMFNDFINIKLTAMKKGAITDKTTGTKIITERDFQSKAKDTELTYISINERYNKIFKKD